MSIDPRSEADHKNIIEQGFTLVELLIVVVILGILAGVVIFSMGNLTNNAGKNACKTEADTFATAYQAYKAQNSGSAVAGASTQAQADNLKTANLLTYTGTLKYLSNAAGQAGGAAANPMWTSDLSGRVTSTNC